MTSPPPLDPCRAFLTRDPAPSGALRIAVKDNVDVAGMPTRAASPALPAVPAAADAPAVARLRAAGAAIVGKTNMHELAFGVTCDNPWSGRVDNPAHPGRLAGGSSGGSAAAVAAGLADGALGTDTGGSIRIPAAFCGIAGLRPSRGRYPAGGVLHLSETYDALGPLAPSVAALARLDAILAGEPPADAASLAGVRLGVTPLDRDALDDEVATAFDETLARLRTAGCAAVEVEPLPPADDWHLTIVLHEAERSWRGLAELLGASPAELAGEIATDGVRAVFAELAAGGGPSAAAYRAARERHSELAAALLARLDLHRLDATIAPASPIVPPVPGERDDDELFRVLTSGMLPATVAGQPSLAAGSLLLDGRPGGDRRLLGIGLALEALAQRG